MGDDRRVADYFVLCGLPGPGKQHLLEEGSLEVNLKPSHNQVWIIKTLSLSFETNS